MLQAYITELGRGVSRARLSSYRSSSGSDLDMAVNYLWNIELSKNLYPGLAALEVTLRSSIHRALTLREGTDLWFQALLEPGQFNLYAQTRLKLYHRLNRIQPTADQVVAELPFGFWTTLLSQPYHQALWAPDRTALVKTVFPHPPPTPSNRHFVHQRCNNLRILRNRVMHHEPVWYRPRLYQEWEDIIEVVGWINPTVMESTLVLDRFDDAFHHGRARLEAGIRRRFGI